VIQAKDRRPIRVFAGYNNTGSQVTKEDRLFAGFNWGNAFGLGHQMTLQWTSDPEARYSRAISGNYTVDLPRSHSATLFGAYSEIESIPAGGLEQAGTSWQTGINYDIPLQPIGRHYTHRVQLGFDFKYSDNNLELALPPFIIPIADNETNIVQFRATYRGTLKDSWGSTSFGLGVTAAPGDLSGKNDDDAFNLSRSLATADYIYGSFDISRSTQLRSFLSGWDWTVRGSLQISNRNLLGSEQFSGGGSSSVRGYEESEVSGDNGVLFSQELILPVLHPSRDLFKSEYRDALRLFVFQDYARTWNVDTLPGEKPFNLLSHGVGLRYQFSQYATLNVSHGWQARDSGSSDTGDDSRTHISFQISY
jgi:hemolysin activation/secretion protein